MSWRGTSCKVGKLLSRKVKLDVYDENILSNSFLNLLVGNSEKVEEMSSFMLLFGLKEKDEGQTVCIGEEDCYLEIYLYYEKGEIWFKPNYLHIDISLLDSDKIVYLPYHTIIHSEESDYQFMNERLGGVYIDDGIGYGMKLEFSGITGECLENKQIGYLNSERLIACGIIKNCEIDYIDSINKATPKLNYLEAIAKGSKIKRIGSLLLTTVYTQGLLVSAKEIYPYLHRMRGGAEVDLVKQFCCVSILERNTLDNVETMLTQYIDYVEGLDLGTKVQLELFGDYVNIEKMKKHSTDKLELNFKRIL